MDFLTLLLLSVGLATDAFAVAVSNGMCYPGSPQKNCMYTALAFGFAQGLMPVLGFLAGHTFAGAIQDVDHWIALVLLSLIGGKMIYETLHEEEEDIACEKPFGLRLVAVQAIATSIDALAVGVSFAAMGLNIFYTSGVIGLVTFFCCVGGYKVGLRFGGAMRRGATLLGGFILIAIGIKILVEHTVML